MEIVEYQKKYEKDFIELNTAWVERFFVMEDADREVLEHVEELLETGAMVYFAVENDHVLATCMAMPLGDDVWEICKLAATGQYTGKGAGSAVFRASMDWAISHGAKKLTLISNRRLKPALHIYEKNGFREIPLNKAYWGFERADIEFEYVVPSSTATVISENMTNSIRV
ncbi:MAG: GNAT family N-acetyltransferase [Lachnospiraceae bacterium]|nr:GNAT family N-acetyltransferase [Lachnospiraceae bacterium]